MVRYAIVAGLCLLCSGSIAKEFKLHFPLIFSQGPHGELFYTDPTVPFSIACEPPVGGEVVCTCIGSNCPGPFDQ
jgi:hypothetical protein